MNGASSSKGIPAIVDEGVAIALAKYHELQTSLTLPPPSPHPLLASLPPISQGTHLGTCTESPPSPALRGFAF